MNEPHKDNTTDTSVEFKEEQPRSLCGNKTGSGCSSLDFKTIIFSQEQIDNFCAFAVTLKRIRVRMMMEGYRIEDGKLIKPKNIHTHDKRRNKT